jgi:hypothetical protein
MTDDRCVCRDPRLGPYQCPLHGVSRGPSALLMELATVRLPKRVCSEPSHAHGPTACWECGGLSDAGHGRLLANILSGDTDLPQPGILS